MIRARVHNIITIAARCGMWKTRETRKSNAVSRSKRSGDRRSTSVKERLMNRTIKVLHTFRYTIFFISFRTFLSTRTLKRTVPMPHVYRPIVATASSAYLSLSLSLSSSFCTWAQLQIPPRTISTIGTFRFPRAWIRYDPCWSDKILEKNIHT